MPQDVANKSKEQRNVEFEQKLAELELELEDQAPLPKPAKGEPGYLARYIRGLSRHLN
jgi:hypothetical protein